LTEELDARRLQVARQVYHWRAVATGLCELETFASAEAWRSLERYLGVALRSHLAGAAQDLVRRTEALVAQLRAATTLEDLERLRKDVIRFRRRYLQVETALAFHGEAIESRRTPRLAAILRACDVMAVASMEPVLCALRRDVPPVLTYVDKGMGASILRAGLRLWDGGSVSPAAAIKIARQNISRPTALVHESGHMVAHLIGWNEELARLLRRELHSAPAGAADAWSGWASEVAADTYAFAWTGYGAVAALHDVVSGESVFRNIPGDPHPVAHLRVLLGVEMSRRFFGAGPWDRLGAAWTAANPIVSAPAETRPLLEASVPLLPRIAELCLLAPMNAFGGRPVTAHVDPMRVRPDALAQLARDAGPSLLTSPYWVRGEALRLLALTSFRAATEPERSDEVARQYEQWILRLGEPVAAAAA
jgi:hypothetical protein